ncbi:hypothetical protein ES703_00234 [subsurface metagenome]
MRVNFGFLSSLALYKQKVKYFFVFDSSQRKTIIRLLPLIRRVSALGGGA